jgi:hypothetical protein
MRLLTILALALAIGLATAVSPFASSHPDGLEKVAADKAFIDSGTEHGGLISDYAFPGVKDERLATGLAGFTGTLLVFAVGFGIVKGARRRSINA